METQAQNLNVIQSVWRRVKKDIKVRDLQPVKDVKVVAVLRANPNQSQAPQASTNRVKESQTVVRSPRCGFLYKPIVACGRRHVASAFSFLLKKILQNRCT